MTPSIHTTELVSDKANEIESFYAMRRRSAIGKAIRLSLTKNYMKKCFLRLLSEEDGQDLVEYSLLLAFIALAAVALLSSVSRNVVTLWQDCSNAFSTALTTAS